MTKHVCNRPTNCLGSGSCIRVTRLDLYPETFNPKLQPFVFRKYGSF